MKAPRETPAEPTRDDLLAQLAERDRELAAARERQAASSEVLRAIASAEGDAGAALQRIAEISARLFGAPSVSIQLAEGDAFVREYRVGAIAQRVGSANPRSVIRVGERNLPGTVVAENRQIHIHDLDHLDSSMADFPGLPHARAGGARTVCATPLRRGVHAIGVLIIFRNELLPFTEDELALQQSFADQAVIAIENARLFDETNEALKQQTATADVLKVISRSAFDLQTVFDTLIRSATELSGAQSGSIFTRDGELFRYRANFSATQRPEWVKFLQENPQRSGRGSAIARAIQAGRTVVIPDIVADPEVEMPGSLGNIRAVLATPMLRDGKVEGVIGLSRPTPGNFTRREIELVETFADQAVIAIENSRLFDETQQALRQQTATADVLKVISRSAFDLRTVLDTLVESAARLCEADMASINRQSAEGYRQIASYGYSPEFNAYMVDHRPPDGAGSIAGRAMASLAPTQIADVLADPDYDFKEGARIGGTRTMLAVPLVREGAPIGVVVLSRKTVRAFTDRQVGLVRTFADQAVIAIENARLFDEVQARTRDLAVSLDRQTATSEILRVISQSPTDAKPVFESIVLTAARLLNCDLAFVMLTDGEVHWVAAAASPQGPQAIANAGRRRVDAAANFPSRAILDKATLHLPDWSLIALPEHERMVHEFYGINCSLYLPLLREGACIGLLTLTSRRVRSFGPEQIAQGESFRDQALIAMENARLFDEVQARTKDLAAALDRQTATSEILRVISESPTDARPVFDRIVVTAARLLNCDFAYIILTDGKRWRAEAGATSSGGGVFRLPDTYPVDPAADFPSRAIAGKTMLHLPDWSEIELPPIEVQIGDELGLRSTLYLPLLKDGDCVGLLVLASQRPRAFGPAEIVQAEAFRDQAMIAMENARLFNETQEALKQQTATADVLKVISRSVFDLKAVFETLLETAVELVDGSGGGIALREGDGLRFQAAAGPRGFATSGIVGRFVEIDRSSAAGRAVVTGKTEYIPDSSLDPEFHSLASGSWGKSYLGVPLSRDGRVEGALTIIAERGQAFTPRLIELIETFADQAMIAIENVRLFDEVQAKTREVTEALERQTATNEVLSVISRSPSDLMPVLETISDTASRLCGSEQTIFFRFDGEFFRFLASWNFPPEVREMLERRPIYPGHPSALGRAGASLKPVYIPDVLADPEYGLKGEQSAARYRTSLAVPLLREGKLIGALSLNRSEPGAFTARHAEIVATFADQAVIAIENARLFEEVQAKTRDLSEALVYQTGSANILKVIASSPTDVAPVLQSIVDSACEVCGALDAAVILREGEMGRFAAHRGSIPIGENTRALNRDWVGGRAILDRLSIHVPDLLDAGDEFPIGRDMALRMGHRTILAVPLMREGESVGAIVVRRDEAQPFTDKQIEVLRSFADQAVIAIGNTRLFDEVQARTRDLTESLAQQTATADVLKVISRSGADLDVMLQTLADTAGALSGNSTIHLQQDGLMRLRVHCGGTPEWIAYLQKRPFPATAATLAGRAWVTGEIVHIPDIPNETDLPWGRAAEISGYRSALSVPIVSRSHGVVGVFSYGSPVTHAFPPRRIELLKSFADQAAIAIDNARLLDEVQARTRELEASLDNLRKAQDRLVETEKLASLGQLTAGIAHEIKNPLNFVNNFSALSRELLEELRDVLAKAPLDKALRDESEDIVGLLDSNLEKVVNHGKRADSIVKNMLLHSREGSGEASMVDVNAMVEEALNLAYHGARAEKPGFNVAIVKSLDPAAGTARVYAQEMTRVLLNLISNGFYATTQRKQAENARGYEPTITASTRDLGASVEISIRDNGAGIPEEVKAKMFNPFFTTKPAGEGTGLGLSLSHDIVVKQHGGAIEVVTELGAFTQFTITLPRAGGAS